ncbi:MAG: glycosyltransferase family 4 protein [Sulfolobales archaeon]
MRTIEVADVNVRKGGAPFRTYRVLKARSSTGIECRSILVDFTKETLRDLLSLCPPLGCASMKRFFAAIPESYLSRPLIRSVPSHMLLNLRFYSNIINTNADVVICHMEDIVCLRTALEISRETGSKSVVILHNPPFYKDIKRISNITGSFLLFHRLRMISEYSLPDIIKFGYHTAVHHLIYNSSIRSLAKLITPSEFMLGGILREFDLILSVSKSIPFEMGWEGRVVAMDPGIGFDEEELGYIKSLRLKKPNESKIHAVFPARPVPEKGLADLLIAIKIIARSRRDFKVAIFTSEKDRMGALIARIAKKLKINDNLILVGYIPQRRDLLKFRASAKLSLYPGHVDAYPYAVAESLLLGTPVVAYDIPALKISYGNLNGVYLAKEGDIEALAQKTLEILDAKNIEVDEPRVKLFSEIAFEEKKILEKHLKIYNV